ncbi:MAG TPA: TPM domain-containing protein [Mesorhizobium sp.]
MSVTPKSLNNAEHRRIAEAIRTAEESTSGEIYCVVAGASDSYFYPSGFIVTLAIVLIGFLLSLGLEAWWLTVRLPVFLYAQILAIACALAVLSLLPAIRIHFVPRRLRYQRAHDNAIKQFLARNVHITAERTGVLIFVSLAEHYAEIVADSGIDAKVGQTEWDSVIGGLIDAARRDELAEGFVTAIGRVGALLAAHFPPRPVNPNELDDHVVEI